MKIIKYKKLKSNKYDVYLEDGNKITLYEDVILQEELLLKKEIKDINELLKKNDYYAISEVALKRLSHHVESVKGMREYLLKKGYDLKDIEENLSSLEKKGYLNDAYYAKCYINNQINLSNDGPLKIIKNLEENGISEDYYQDLLNKYHNLWSERINKYLQKQLKINKKSNYYFKNKMLMNLINLGYEREMINESLSHIYINNLDELKKKEEDKIRLKLSRKYEGEELERKIREKLYQRGFFE